MNTITKSTSSTIVSSLERVIIDLNKAEIIINGETFDILKEEWNTLTNIIEAKLNIMTNMISFKLDSFEEINKNVT